MIKMKKIIITLASGKCIANTIDEETSNLIFKTYNSYIVNNGKVNGEDLRIYIDKPNQKERIIVRMDQIASIQEEVSNNYRSSN
jgi:hypothetical protein